MLQGAWLSEREREGRRGKSLHSKVVCIMLEREPQIYFYVFFYIWSSPVGACAHGCACVCVCPWKRSPETIYSNLEEEEDGGRKASMKTLAKMTLNSFRNKTNEKTHSVKVFFPS